ncbi:MAG: hypothetical protein ACK4Q5_02680 [Saprospiraceae bacterium]
MKNHIAIALLMPCLIAVATAPRLVAQEPSETTGHVAFAFLLSGLAGDGDRPSPSALPKDNPKYRTAKRVYDDLVHARGDLRLPPPEFFMNRRQNYVAWMDADKVLIGLEEKAYDVCASFGADSLNALAALLGHEITHYYEKHDWTRHFSAENSGSALGQQIERIEEGIKHEAQADYFGGYLATSAGYQVHGIMPRLLDALYKAYGLGEHITGYPSLPERKAMSCNSQAKLHSFEAAFEMANLLTVLGEYQEAAAYHRLILREFQSREIYNNAGVLAMLAALRLSENSRTPLFFPLELDPLSRFGNNRKSATAANPAELMTDAESYFSKAAALDPDYAPAFLNLGCVHAYLGNLDDAAYYARKAMRLSQQQNRTDLQADVNLLLGIIAHSTGNIADAKHYFEIAHGMGSPLGSANLDLLEGKNPIAGQSLANADTPPLETIDELSLERFAHELVVDRTVELESGRASFGVKKMPHSCVYVHMADKGKQLRIVQATQEDYPGHTARGIALGATKAEVEAIYGQSSQYIHAATGQFLVYFPAQIAFRFDANGRLAGWFTFRIK